MCRVVQPQDGKAGTGTPDQDVEQAYGTGWLKIFKLMMAYDM